MIFSFFKKDPTAEVAVSLYQEIVAAARRPHFYAEWQVPDTPVGRFELLSVHIYLVLRHLKEQGDGYRSLSQALFDVFFKNLDDSLREMGVGDLSVARKIRGLAEAFYGRVGAYGSALDDSNAGDLADALSRNVYETEKAVSAPDLAKYVMAAQASLEDQALTEICKGHIQFPNPAT